MDYSKMLICEIAVEVNRHIAQTKQKAYGASPYIFAMLNINHITDTYYLDKGKDIVIRFLCNASTLKGGEMPAIKKELNKRIKN